MPLWGARQAGGNAARPELNFRDICPGLDYTLLDGTETIVSGSKSIAFARGMMGSTDAGSTFIAYGCSNGSIIQIQSSNGVPTTQQGSPDFTLTDLDATFMDIAGATITGGGGAAGGSYTDVGRPSFYRAVVVTFAAGDTPVLIVKR